jgi:hypothetical protein
LNAERQRGITNKCKQKPSWECPRPISLTCVHHGEALNVPCGRWRTCTACALRKQWELRQRFLAGIVKAPKERPAVFFTLTFPASRAPSEAEAQSSWRGLVSRLRYRQRLGAYGWVLQRTKLGTLHFHGIAHMEWFEDDLREWRELVTASGFGIQNRLVRASAAHAAYCARYIASDLADLAPLRRAFGFSRAFPLTDYEEGKKLVKAHLPALQEAFGVEPDCVWLPDWEVWR